MSPKMIFAALGLFILVLGAGAGFYLLGQSQDLRQQAAVAYPVPSPTPSVACKGALEACDSGANACCGGLVCQGVDGNRKCQQQTENQYGTGFTCGGSNGWLGFQCDSLNGGESGAECLSNMRVFSDPGEAYRYASANGCGQVDEVCSGGPNQNKLCGSFQIISTNCGGGPVATPQATPQATPRVTPTPRATPTPAPSPTPGVTPTPGVSPSPSPSPGVTPSPAPICANISISKSNIVVGDNVTFTCGTVAGATSYEFRVKLPDGTTSTVVPMTSGSTQSQTFTIAQQGDYKAQCRICVGDACQEWEAL